MNGKPIFVLEPQMEGVQHAPFNAALLHALVLAHPDIPITFQSLSEHMTAVRSILQEHESALTRRIEWRSMDRPKNRGILTRWLHGQRMIRQVLSTGNRILFCSVSRMQLLQLKRSMRPSDVVRVVLHGDIDRLDHPAEKGFLERFLSLHRVILRPNPVGLRYLLLGESIRRCIPAAFKAALANSGVIDHPYHFPVLSSDDSVGTENGLIFGTFGNTGNGEMLEEVARRVRKEDASVGFRLVGYLSGPEAVERVGKVVEGATDKALSREEFQQRAHALTHTLWLAPSDGFRLRASGTFFDALAHLKPLIYTANPYIDSYDAEAAGIGFRCASVDEVVRVILQLASENRPAEYEAMKRAMIRFRERFTPASLARRLPSELLW